MANIGRAYGRIMPTVAALLRGVFSPEQGKKQTKRKKRKEKKKKKERMIEKDTGNVGESRQMSRMCACLRVASVYAFLINVTAKKTRCKVNAAADHEPRFQ